MASSAMNSVEIDYLNRVLRPILPDVNLLNIVNKGNGLYQAGDILIQQTYSNFTTSTKNDLSNPKKNMSEEELFGCLKKISSDFFAYDTGVIKARVEFLNKGGANVKFLFTDENDRSFNLYIPNDPNRLGSIIETQAEIKSINEQAVSELDQFNVPEMFTANGEHTHNKTILKSFMPGETLEHFFKGYWSFMRDLAKDKNLKPLIEPFRGKEDLYKKPEEIESNIQRAKQKYLQSHRLDPLGFEQGNPNDIKRRVNEVYKAYEEGLNPNSYDCTPNGCERELKFIEDMISFAFEEYSYWVEKKVVFGAKENAIPNMFAALMSEFGMDFGQPTDKVVDDSREISLARLAKRYVSVSEVEKERAIELITECGLSLVSAFVLACDEDPLGLKPFYLGINHHLLFNRLNKDMSNLMSEHKIGRIDAYILSQQDDVVKSEMLGLIDQYDQEYGVTMDSMGMHSAIGQITGHYVGNLTKGSIKLGVEGVNYPKKIAEKQMREFPGLSAKFVKLLDESGIDWSEIPSAVNALDLNTYNTLVCSKVAGFPDPDSFKRTLAFEDKGIISNLATLLNTGASDKTRLIPDNKFNNDVWFERIAYDSAKLMIKSFNESVKLGYEKCLDKPTGDPERDMALKALKAVDTETINLVNYLNAARNLFADSFDLRGEGLHLGELTKALTDDYLFVGKLTCHPDDFIDQSGTFMTSDGLWTVFDQGGDTVFISNLDYFVLTKNMLDTGSFAPLNKLGFAKAPKENLLTEDIIAALKRKFQQESIVFKNLKSGVEVESNYYAFNPLAHS